MYCDVMMEIAFFFQKSSEDIMDSKTESSKDMATTL